MIPFHYFPIMLKVGFIFSFSFRVLKYKTFCVAICIELPFNADAVLLQERDCTSAAPHLPH